MKGGLMDREEMRIQRAAIEASTQRKHEQATRRWRIAKQAVWLALLAGAFLVYFLIAVMVESIDISFPSF
jgi:hypothetical protein